MFATTVWFGHGRDLENGTWLAGASVLIARVTHMLNTTWHQPLLFKNKKNPSVLSKEQKSMMLCYRLMRVLLQMDRNICACGQLLITSCTKSLDKGISVSCCPTLYLASLDIFRRVNLSPKPDRFRLSIEIFPSVRLRGSGLDVAAILKYFASTAYCLPS